MLVQIQTPVQNDGQDHPHTHEKQAQDGYEPGLLFQSRLEYTHLGFGSKIEDIHMLVFRIAFDNLFGAAAGPVRTPNNRPISDPSAGEFLPMHEKFVLDSSRIRGRRVSVANVGAHARREDATRSLRPVHAFPSPHQILDPQIGNPCPGQDENLRENYPPKEPHTRRHRLHGNPLSLGT